jgi:CRISPR-associated protein (TIGR02710 family)
MARVMLISLGTGPSVEQGIAYSIKTHRPDRVIFFTTPQSAPTQTKVEALLDERLPMETIPIGDGDNPDEIYRAAYAKLGELRYEEVLVDFTSGTKAMSAGLVAAAIAQGIKQLIYVSGSRGPDGRVLSGTERVLTLKPAQILADRLKHQIIMLFSKRLFGAALQLIDQGLEEIQLPEHRRDLEDLKRLCLAYQAWDWFDHCQAHKYFQQIDRGLIRRWSEQIAQNKGWVAQIAQADHSEKLLIDLWLNAERRMEEGHWMDAVARLYRLTELIAQFRLKRRYDLESSDVDVSKLPQELQGKYERLRDEKGRVKLGLRQSFELLTELGDPLGERYDDRLEGALQARNESIAGHGLCPVTREGCERLAEKVCQLLKDVCPDWEQWAHQGQFAQLEW